MNHTDSQETIGSVEFGDWINNELLAQGQLAASGEPQLRMQAKWRIEELEQAKRLLLRFLILQDEMLQSADRLGKTLHKH